jgi:hypothetical protein
MPALVPLILLPTKQGAAYLHRLPALKALAKSAVLEVCSVDGSPMPQAKISRLRLLTKRNAPRGHNLADHEAIEAKIKAQLSRVSPEDFVGALGLWNSFTLQDIPQDRISHCAEWRRHIAASFATYLGLNHGRPDFIRIGDIRGRLATHLDHALSPFEDSDHLQVFIRRSPGEQSGQKFPLPADSLHDDLSVWAAHAAPDIETVPAILQTTDGTLVRMTKAPSSISQTTPKGCFDSQDSHSYLRLKAS